MNTRCDICTRPLSNAHQGRDICTACTPAPPGKYPEPTLRLRNPLVRHGLIYRQKEST